MSTKFHELEVGYIRKEMYSNLEIGFASEKDTVSVKVNCPSNSMSDFIAHTVNIDQSNFNNINTNHVMDYYHLITRRNKQITTSIET